MNDLPKEQQMKILQTVTVQFTFFSYCFNLNQTLDVTPQELLESIVNLTRQSTKELTAEIDAIDFKKEAQELRQVYTKNIILICRSAYERSSDTGMRDVFELLQQQRNGHIQRFLETEHNLNQAFDTELETEKLLQERNSQLDKVVSSSLREGIKQLLDLDIEIAADRAAIQILEKSIIEKKSNKKDLEKESEILATKYSQIQQLQKQIVIKFFLVFFLFKKG